MIQFSHPLMTTGKTIATIWTFVGKMMSLLFNMPSRFVIAFRIRSKHVLISVPPLVKSKYIMVLSRFWVTGGNRNLFTLLIESTISKRPDQRRLTFGGAPTHPLGRHMQKCCQLWALPPPVQSLMLSRETTPTPASRETNPSRSSLSQHSFQASNCSVSFPSVLSVYD